MIKYILTDIEGTTTAVSFVYEILFPYFKNHFKKFAEENQANLILKENIAAVQKTILEEEGSQIDENQAIDKLLYWTDIDRKHTALKNLQGLVWRIGYEIGEIKGHIYPDVPPALEKWKNQGLQIGVYSSGSVEAQKLIFGFSNFGDLLSFFSNNFDTNIGFKRESESYTKIAQTLILPSNEILFLSDVEAELDAAQSVGFQTIQLVRVGTIPSQKHKTVKDFSEIDIEISLNL